jgi:DNA-binding MarR family transcriptional regulator
LKTAYKYEENIPPAFNLWVKLAGTSAIFGQLIAENIRSYELTEPQFAVLECLGHIGTMNLTALSRKLRASGGNLTCIIDNLEENGLVYRVHSKEDRRVIFIRLTSKGKRLFTETFTPTAEFIASVVSVLNRREQQALSDLLRKLGRSLQEIKSYNHGKQS